MPRLPALDGLVLLETQVVGEPRDVPVVRREVVAAVRGRGVMDDTVDAVELLATELVTNAVRHGRGPVTVRAALVRSGTLRVDVHDAAPGQVVPAEFDLWATGGRGLAMVELVSYQWGCTSALDGKSVWFEVVLAFAPSVQLLEPTSLVT